MRLEDLDIQHHFAHGAVIKETRIPAGTALVQHAHRYAHLSYLVSGAVNVTVDGRTATRVGPCCMVIEAGKLHGVGAVTDAIWLCVHAEPDAQSVDANQVLASGADEMQAMLERIAA